RSPTPPGAHTASKLAELDAQASGLDTLEGVWRFLLQRPCQAVIGRESRSAYRFRKPLIHPRPFLDFSINDRMLRSGSADLAHMHLICNDAMQLHMRCVWCMSPPTFASSTTS